MTMLYPMRVLAYFNNVQILYNNNKIKNYYYFDSEDIHGRDKSHLNSFIAQFA